MFSSRPNQIITNYNSYHAGSGLSGLVDISVAPYSAPGNGSNDDDPIIRAAIAALSNVNDPGYLYFPKGTYKLLNTMVLSGLNILAHPGAIFKPGSVSLTMVSPRLNSSWEGGLIDCRSILYTGNVFSIDGEYKPGISFPTRAPRISRVGMWGNNFVAGGGGRGIYIFANSANTPKVTFGTFSDLLLVGFSEAIKLYTGGNGWVTANNFYNLKIGACGTGILLETAGGASYNTSGNFFSQTQMQPTTANPVSVDCVKIIDSDYNEFNSLFTWDVSNCSGYSLNIVSGIGNQFRGGGFAATYDYVFDGGTNTVIEGYYNKSWSGADLGQSQTVTYSAGTMSDGGIYTSPEFDFPGLDYGDFLLLGKPKLASCLAHAILTATGKYKIVIFNETGGNSSTTGTTWKVLRIPKRLKTMSFVWNPAEIAPGGQVTTTVTVPGAALEDFVFVGPAVVVTDCYVSATVTSANSVTVVIHNYGDAVIDLVSSVWSLKLIKGDKCTAITTEDFSSLSTGNGETQYTAASMDTGLALGQIVLWSPGVNVAGALCCAYIENVSTIAMRLQNDSGSTVDLPSTAMRLKVIEAGDGYSWM